METKKCSRCKEEKAVKEFYHDKYRPDGLTVECKVCGSLKAKKSYYKNREKNQKRALNYFYRHRDKIIEEDRQDRLNNPMKFVEYRKKHRDYMIAYSRNYNQINKQLIRHKSKAYYQTIKDKNTEKARRYREANRIKVRAHDIANRYYGNNIKHKDKMCELCNMRHANIKHHDDYTKPLDIQWLCYECHTRKHAILKRSIAC